MIFPEIDLTHGGRSLWEAIQHEWESIVAEYELSPADFYASWYYLDCHPAFWDLPPGIPPGTSPVMWLDHTGRISAAICMRPVRTTPAGEVDDNPGPGTCTKMWYELGKIDFHPDGHRVSLRWHDWPHDGSCATYEEAIITVAAKVHEHYGNDRTIVDDPGWSRKS